MRKIPIYSKGEVIGLIEYDNILDNSIDFEGDYWGKTLDLIWATGDVIRSYIAQKGGEKLIKVDIKIRKDGLNENIHE